MNPNPRPDFEPQDLGPEQPRMGAETVIFWRRSDNLSVPVVTSWGALVTHGSPVGLSRVPFSHVCTVRLRRTEMVILGIKVSKYRSQRSPRGVLMPPKWWSVGFAMVTVSNYGAGQVW